MDTNFLYFLRKETTYDRRGPPFLWEETILSEGRMDLSTTKWNLSRFNAHLCWARIFYISSGKKLSMIGEVLLFSGRRRYYHRGGWIFRRRNEISRVLMLTRVGHEFSIFLQERNHLWSEKSSFSLGGDDFPRENEISLSLSLSRFDNYSYILLFRGKVWRKRRVMKKREEGEKGERVTYLFEVSRGVPTGYRPWRPEHVPKRIPSPWHKSVSRSCSARVVSLHQRGRTRRWPSATSERQLLPTIASDLKR